MFGIDEFFYKLIYNFCGGLLILLDGFISAFLILAGAKEVTDNAGNTADNLIVSLFSNEIVQNIFYIFLAIGVLIYVIVMIWSCIKAVLNKDVGTEMKKVIKNILKSFVMLLVVPIVVFFSIHFVSLVLSSLVKSLNLVMGVNGGGSIADYVWMTGFTNNIGKLSGTSLNFLSGYDNLVNAGFDMSFGGDFNHLLVIFLVLVVGFAIIVASVGLGTRIYDIIKLYILAPTTISTMALDDGKRFELWKEQFTGKLLNVFGAILSVYVFVFVVDICKDIFLDESSVEKVYVFVILMVAGAMSITKGTAMISGLLSQGGGQAEAQTAMQTGGILRTGAFMGARMAGAALRGSRMARMAGDFSKGSSGGGGFSLGGLPGMGDSPEAKERKDTLAKAREKYGNKPATAWDAPFAAGRKLANTKAGQVAGNVARTGATIASAPFKGANNLYKYGLIGGTGRNIAAVGGAIRNKRDDSLINRYKKDTAAEQAKKQKRSAFKTGGGF